VSTEIIYLCIYRTEHGEKIAEKVSSRIPEVGEIISISYLDAQGNFEVLNIGQRTILDGYELVSVQVRPLHPRQSRNRLSKGIRSIYTLPQSKEAD
jgi:hypothetical protein